MTYYEEPAPSEPKQHLHEFVSDVERTADKITYGLVAIGGLCFFAYDSDPGMAVAESTAVLVQAGKLAVTSLMTRFSS